MMKTPSELTITAWARMLRASQRCTEQVEVALKRADLPPLAWYDVLLELYRAGDDGLRQFELAKKMLLPKHNLSRLIDRLQGKQLAQRYLCEEDGRGNVVSITDSGKTLLRRMWPVYAAEITSLMADKLDNAEQKQLAGLLEKLLA